MRSTTSVRDNPLNPTVTYPHYVVWFRPTRLPISLKENPPSRLGFAASYGKTVQYEISTAYHPQLRILSSESGTLVRYVGDNADINVYTLDDNNTLMLWG
ncbi:hypothetical protein TNCV_4022471 [Trichonephila clavipes]|nr:hypothetical protein TNCV_4022471 [Trichonephila clavipes]